MTDSAAVSRLRPIASWVSYQSLTAVAKVSTVVHVDTTSQAAHVGATPTGAMRNAAKRRTRFLRRPPPVTRSRRVIDLVGLVPSGGVGHAGRFQNGQRRRPCQRRRGRCSRSPSTAQALAHPSRDAAPPRVPLGFTTPRLFAGRSCGAVSFGVEGDGPNSICSSSA
ncbi:hypothetical protein LX36DRAFT_660165 [Colletotrichum falcatum]|nr:hypothetical protein LX36DRAFT_660165 [Colletotrichum falcatum]